MNIRQNPFSVYDFLGYFTPGAIFIAVAFVLFEPLVSHASVIANVDKPAFYILFVLLSYTMGHLLSFLSSITVEKYCVDSLGYPSKYLLKIPVKGYFEGISNRKLFARFLFLISIWPVSVLDWIFGFLLKFRASYAKPLDEFLRETIEDKIQELLEFRGIKRQKLHEEDFFRFVYHFSVENSPNHLPKMQNYVALYGFVRTMSLSFIFLSWFLLIGVFREYSNWSLNMALGSSVVAYVFYLSFVKFYRRFSLEVFMAVSVSSYTKDS